MAALIMPKLGEPATCDGPCQHTDCAYWRRVVGSPCTICGQPVEAGRRFYFAAPGNDDVQHAVCLEESIESERARWALKVAKT